MSNVIPFRKPAPVSTGERRLHPGEPSFKCGVCSKLKSYERSMEYVTGQSVATGEAHYGRCCEKCSKMFRRK